MNRTLMEKARNMLSGVRLAQEFQPEVVDTTCYLVNRLLSTALVDKNPWEAWVGQRPFLTHLRVIGCDAFMYVPEEKINMINKKLEKCILIR